MLIRLPHLMLLVLGVAGCVPFTVGTTARPTPVGEVVPSMAFYSAPAGSLLDSTETTLGDRYVLFDLEARFGIDGQSDLGVRMPGSSGVVVNYKRLLTPADESRAVVAAMVGGGFVNLGNHLHFEGTLIASGPDRTATPYGGLRAMQVIPIGNGAVSDSPSIGLFAGLRIGKIDLAVSPEVGFYYDRSALDIREGNFILIPSVTLHGTELFRILDGGGMW